MKTKYIATGLTLCAMLALAGGCSKADEEKAATDAKQMMEKTSNVVNKAETMAKEAKDKAAEVKDKAESAIQSANGGDAQGLITKAQGQVADKQYQPALDTLQKLSSYKLSDDQQSMVDGLKGQIQKLMAANPAGAASGLLPK